MIKEIGSEFWDDRCNYSNQGNYYQIQSGGDEVYLLSGRTALDYIIKDASKTSGLKKIALPSYCCRTMIEPFTINGISIHFYDVSILPIGGLTANIDYVEDCDAIYVMDYFGFSENRLLPLDDTIFNGRLIIHDVTHSVFTEDALIGNVDYLYASYRKWAFLPGLGIAIKMKGNFALDKPTDLNTNYLELRRKSGIDKARYILDAQGSKGTYLDNFKCAEELLDRDFRDYAADTESIDMLSNLNLKTIKKKRQRNARVLLEALNNHSLVVPLFKTLSDGDCPLCVPVLVKDGKRNSLREYLKSKNIYCPIHWPLSANHKISNEARKMYDLELSLVCDQRYGDLEMYYIIDEINNFMKI